MNILASFDKFTYNFTLIFIDFHLYFMIYNKHIIYFLQTHYFYMLFMHKGGIKKTLMIDIF